MAFVNEYASEEDIERFQLVDAWRRYHLNRKRPAFEEHPPSWTIDRERNAFLMWVGHGTRECGHLMFFLLWVDGQEARYTLWLNEKSTPKLDANPFVQIWEKGKVDRYPGFDLPDSDADTLLKEALTVYGYWGARKQLPNTIVKFNF